MGAWINEQRESQDWKWYHKLGVGIGIMYLVAILVIGLIAAFSFPG